MCPADPLSEIISRLTALEAGEPETFLSVSDLNVSNPPTDAELDAAFGTPATAGDGFTRLIDDDGTGSNVWLVVAKNGKWWYEELTAAL